MESGDLLNRKSLPFHASGRRRDRMSQQNWMIVACAAN
jgi:hypothetical protein